MSTAITTVASTVNRMPSGQSSSNGICRCKPGGSGRCAGCEEKPVYGRFSKPSGRNGTAGAVGVRRPEKLLEGEQGKEGRVEITVRHKNGERRKYGSAFKLELVGFDVEDENADGIFEPGEDIFVRRIRVRNKGGYSGQTEAS